MAYSNGESVVNQETLTWVILVIMRYLDKWTDKVKVVVEQPCKTIEASEIASRRTSVPCSIDELPG